MTKRKFKQAPKRTYFAEAPSPPQELLLMPEVMARTRLSTRKFIEVPR